MHHCKWRSATAKVARDEDDASLSSAIPIRGGIKGFAAPIARQRAQARKAKGCAAHQHHVGARAYCDGGIHGQIRKMRLQTEQHRRGTQQLCTLKEPT